MTPEMHMGVPMTVVAVVSIPGGTLRVPMMITLQSVDLRQGARFSSYGDAYGIEATLDAMCVGRGTLEPSEDSQDRGG